MNRVQAIWRKLKNWQKVAVILVGLALLRGIAGGPTPASKAPAKTANESEVKSSAPATPPFSSGEVTKETVENQVRYLKSVKAEVTDDPNAEGKKRIRLVYDMGSAWDETTAFKSFTFDAVSAYEKLFANEKVGAVVIEIETTFKDQYGKESSETAFWMEWRRETANKVEWKNFRDMAKVEPNRAYDLAYAYVIHPGVYGKIDAKYRAKVPMTGHK